MRDKQVIMEYIAERDQAVYVRDIIEDTKLSDPYHIDDILKELVEEDILDKGFYDKDGTIVAQYYPTVKLHNVLY